MYDSPMKSTIKRDTLVLSIDDTLRAPSFNPANAKYSVGRDMVGEHVILSNTELKGKTSPV
jgi:hypothetical protein